MEAGAPTARPVVIVHGWKGGHYTLEAPWLDEPIREDSRVRTLASIVVDMIYAWLEANPPLLCMHCAAAEFDGRLVIFPSTNRAGKSSLVTRLMADTVVCYGDDLLAVTPEGQGMSFGVPPRLRRPLPPAEKKLAAFIRAHSGPADKWNQYVASGLRTMAPFGQVRPIGAFVMLTRTETGPAELFRVDAADSLRNMVSQNLMRRGSARTVFEHSLKLTEEKPCWQLRYSRLDDAVAVLRTAFAPGTGKGFAAPPHSGEGDAAPLQKQPETRQANSADKAALPAPTRSPSDETWVRRTDILRRQSKDGYFLFQEAGDAIFHLNLPGGAVWELLSEPLSEAEAVDLLAFAFPQTPRAVIASDVITLFEALEEKGLIIKYANRPN